MLLVSLFLISWCYHPMGFTYNSQILFQIYVSFSCCILLFCCCLDYIQVRYSTDALILLSGLHYDSVLRACQICFQLIARCHPENKMWTALDACSQLSLLIKPTSSKLSLWKLNLCYCRDLNLVGLNIWHLEMWSYCWASKSTASLNSVRRVQTFFPISHTQKQQKLISSTLSPLSQAEVSVRWIVAFFFRRWSLYSLVLPLKHTFWLCSDKSGGGKNSWGLEVYYLPLKFV